ncbi:MAG TPA: VOC family protein [Candidatus Tectomicrobia bacterium]|jgi:glyoxylase I family protein|nr:VOC family protein [Candidatus Tectomicrobia bacterium]
MFRCTNVDHIAINTHDMEATLQFYCGTLGMRLARTALTPDGRRHYSVEISGGTAFAVFDGAKPCPEGTPQSLNHLALVVATAEEFDEAYERLQNRGVKVTGVIERSYGKTFYFHDPNGIRLQIELQTREPEQAPYSDPNPVPFVRKLVEKTSS